MSGENQEESDNETPQFRWSAKVVDEKKGQTFKIKVTPDEVRVYPLDEDYGLGTFMRFVEFVQKHVDPEAEVVVDE
jgi:hypothetical protein